MAVSVAAAGALAGAAPAVEAQTGQGRVRVVHMSPDAPAVDVLVNNQRAVTNLAFRSASPYAALPGGTYNVQVVPTGQTQPVVIRADLPVAAGQDQTVVATGQLANIAPLVLPDDNSAPPAGQAKVRFVHASPDAPAVDVAVTGGPTLFSNVAFRGSAGYNPVAAGTYNLEVRPAGTQDVALRVPNVTLQPGQIVTIFAAGLAGNNTLSAVPVVYQAAGMAGAMPRTGTGGMLTADTSTSPWLIGGLAAIAGALLLGAPALAAARRRTR